MITNGSWMVVHPERRKKRLGCCGCLYRLWGNIELGISRTPTPQGSELGPILEQGAQRVYGLEIYLTTALLFNSKRCQSVGFLLGMPDLECYFDHLRGF